MSVTLDSTCGYRIMWRDHLPENYVGIDIRSEVKPTILADTKKLPIKDGAVDFIYFDPPHHIPAKGFWGNKKYGRGLTVGQKIKLFVEINKEFARTLNENGFIVAKITNMPSNKGFSHHHMDERLERELTNFKLISKATHSSRSNFPNKALVNWMVFRCLG